MRNPHLYKLYGYGVYKGKPIPKIAQQKVTRKPSILGLYPKFNMEPENDGFQEELPFLGTSFQVPC